MIDDSHINNLAKNLVFAVFIRALLQKCVTQIYRALYGDTMFVPPSGTNMVAVK